MKRLVTIVLFVVFVGCEELEQPNINQFVTEGFLTAGFKVNDIKVKETVDIGDSILDIPIVDAIVRVSSAQQEVQLAYDPSTQKYSDSTTDFDIIVGESYKVEIVVGETVATASTVVPEKPTELELTKTKLVVPALRLSFSLRDQLTQLFDEEFSVLTWDGEPGRSYFVVIETQEKELDPVLPEGIPEESVELLSSFRFVTAPSENTFFIISAVALETYGRHVAKVYSVNKEYVDLFNSTDQDSRDLNEPPSNLQNGLGIFTAFAVDSVEFELRRE